MYKEDRSEVLDMMTRIALERVRNRACCAPGSCSAVTPSRSRLLLWSTLCFVALAVNNVLLFVDLVVVPDVDLRFVRGGSAMVVDSSPSLLALDGGSLLLVLRGRVLSTRYASTRGTFVC